MPIVIVKPAEADAMLANRARKLQNFYLAVLVDSSAIHSGIHINEQINPTAGALRNRLGAVCQGGNGYFWKGGRNLPHARSTRADVRIGDQNVLRAGFAGNQQLKRGRAFHIDNVVRDQPLNYVCQLRSFHMRTPAIDVASQKPPGGLYVVLDLSRVDSQRRRHKLLDAGDEIIGDCDALDRAFHSC